MQRPKRRWLTVIRVPATTGLPIITDRSVDRVERSGLVALWWLDRQAGLKPPNFK